MSSKEFYRLLSRGDGVFVFQTFPDNPVARADQGTRRRLTRVLRGTGAQHYAELKALSNQGAGIFMAVNEMHDALTEKGFPVRGTQHLKSVRSYYADLDDLDAAGKKDAYARLLASELPPSAIVESRNGFHVYWLAHEGEDHEFYSEVEQGIRDFWGACPRALDSARVLRAPGFPHLKDPGDPFMVRVVHLDPEARYVSGEIASAFPPPVLPVYAGGPVGDIRPPAHVRDHVRVLATIDKAVAIWHQPPWCHAHALGLSARLYWYGLPLEASLDIIARVVAATGDDELDDRLTACRTTYARAAQGQPVSMDMFGNRDKPLAI